MFFLFLQVIFEVCKIVMYLNKRFKYVFICNYVMCMCKWYRQYIQNILFKLDLYMYIEKVYLICM